MTPDSPNPIVDEAALAWLTEPGDRVVHGPDIAPGEPAAEHKKDAGHG